MPLHREAVALPVIQKPGNFHNNYRLTPGHLIPSANNVVWHKSDGTENSVQVFMGLCHVKDQIQEHLIKGLYYNPLKYLIPKHAFQYIIEGAKLKNYEKCV